MGSLVVIITQRQVKAYPAPLSYFDPKSEISEPCFKIIQQPYDIVHSKI